MVLRIKALCRPLYYWIFKYGECFVYEVVSVAQTIPGQVISCIISFDWFLVRDVSVPVAPLSVIAIEDLLGKSMEKLTSVVLSTVRHE